ncbi:MAG: carboxynorspermidine decarboxylase, partial [Paramuribaculum sp.]|nr:carboxynorspermidine decarboxylase [Paramuribaculum sp.]
MTDEKTAIILGDNPPTPYYIVYEDRLRRNLRLINEVERESGANIIMAFKANALWRTFHIIAEYNRDFTASSLNELQLGTETLGGSAHSYCPAYTDDTIDRYLALSSHITFNSLSQAQRFAARAVAAGVSPGLRVNPACSVIETDIYNPALPGSRFGVTAEQLDAGELPAEIEGFHFHALCESTSYDLERVLEAFEDQFGKYLPALKWINMGGGHLMTREGYDTRHLISLIKDFRRRHTNLEVILEPGSAFTWRTGDLITSVVDIVENQGIKTAIIDASFACHMPDCLEMPYKPAITEALPEPQLSKPTYRLGGN